MNQLLNRASGERRALSLEMFSRRRADSLYGWMIEPAFAGDGIETAAHIFGGAQTLETILLAELPFEHGMGRK